MKLLGYIRTCADEQQNTIEAQDSLLHLFCNLYPKHTLVDVIVDKNTSTATPFEQRKGGNKVIALLQSGKATGLLITELNRAFSVSITGLVQEQWFGKNHLAIFTILDRIDTSHPEGWWTFAGKMITSEYEHRKLHWQDKHTPADTDRKNQALPYIPFGCVSLDKTTNTTTISTLYRDPVVWQIREIIMELQKQNMSPQHICEYLYHEQIPAPDGSQVWHTSTVSGLIESYDSLKCLPKLPITPKTESTLAS